MVKPILFSTPMVKAILDGRKSQTRRVVKFSKGLSPTWSGYTPDGAVLYGSNNVPAAKAPYKPGDILWVRETWLEHKGGYLYKANGMHEALDALIGAPAFKWRPSIFMPREAAIPVYAFRTSEYEPAHFDTKYYEGIRMNVKEAGNV